MNTTKPAHAFLGNDPSASYWDPGSSSKPPRQISLGPILDRLQQPKARALLNYHDAEREELAEQESWERSESQGCENVQFGTTPENKLYRGGRGGRRDLRRPRPPKPTQPYGPKGGRPPKQPRRGPPPPKPRGPPYNPRKRDEIYTEIRENNAQALRNFEDVGRLEITNLDNKNALDDLEQKILALQDLQESFLSLVTNPLQTHAVSNPDKSGVIQKEEKTSSPHDLPANVISTDSKKQEIPVPMDFPFKFTGIQTKESEKEASHHVSPKFTCFDNKAQEIAASKNCPATTIKPLSTTDDNKVNASKGKPTGLPGL